VVRHGGKDKKDGVFILKKPVLGTAEVRVLGQEGEEVGNRSPFP
jgi:hypothetical protein